MGGVSGHRRQGPPPTDDVLTSERGENVDKPKVSCRLACNVWFKGQPHSFSVSELVSHRAINSWMGEATKHWHMLFILTHYTSWPS